MDKTEFYKKLDRIRDLPTLPEVAVKLNNLLDSPDTTIDQVSDTIKKDQAIVGKMLRLVNSSFFGLEAKVTTVPRAVVILGFNTVRNALVSVSIIDSTKNIQGDGIDMKVFWKHAISCAVIGKHLSFRSHIGLPEEAFTAGIIHDIGKLVLAKFFSKEFSEIIKIMDFGSSFYSAETKVIPVHHNEIGAYLSERWRLPKIICDAIRYSHSKSPSHKSSLGCLVACADNIVNTGCLNDTEACVSNLSLGEIPEQLRTEIEGGKQWIPETVQEIEAACSILISGGNNGDE